MGGYHSTSQRLRLRLAYQRWPCRRVPKGKLLWERESVVGATGRVLRGVDEDNQVILASGKGLESYLKQLL